MPAKKRSPLIPVSVTWRKAGDTGVILDLETSEYYSLNDTGTFIWELLSAGKKPGDLAAALADEYGIPLSRAEEDAAAFLKDLAKLKVIATEAEK